MDTSPPVIRRRVSRLAVISVTLSSYEHRERSRWSTVCAPISQPAATNRPSSSSVQTRRPASGFAHGYGSPIRPVGT